MSISMNTIDKLVQFGMSMAVAQQMISTMNHCMANMAIPGISSRPVQIHQQDYYYIDNGVQVGPFKESDIEKFVATSRIERCTLCWRVGLTGWTSAESIPEINKLFLLNNK